MVRTILGRVGLGLGAVWAVVTITFVASHAAPGDPAALLAGPGASPEQLEAMRTAWGFDRSLGEQYVRWMVRFVSGDWGTSLAQGRPVTTVLAEAVGPTVLLVGVSLAASYLLGIAIGVFQAARSRSAWDTGVSIVTLIVYGLPSYWLALVLIMVFAYHASVAGWPAWLQFPAFGLAGLDAEFLPWSERVMDRLRHLALPAVTLSLIGGAAIARFVRGSMLEVRRQPFVVAARARGLPGRRVAYRHTLRNALLPVVTLLGLNLPALFSGTVFVEAVFGWPGMGRVIVSAVSARDYPVVLAVTGVFATLVVIGNGLADVLYAAVDPRLRRRGA